VLVLLVVDVLTGHYWLIVGVGAALLGGYVLGALDSRDRLRVRTVAGWAVRMWRREDDGQDDEQDDVPPPRGGGRRQAADAPDARPAGAQRSGAARAAGAARREVA
jgi:hypothetical protein